MLWQLLCLNVCALSVCQKDFGEISEKQETSGSIITDIKDIGLLKRFSAYYNTYSIPRKVGYILTPIEKYSNIFKAPMI